MCYTTYISLNYTFWVIWGSFKFALSINTDEYKSFVGFTSVLFCKLTNQKERKSLKNKSVTYIDRDVQNKMQERAFHNLQLQKLLFL